MNLIVVPIPLFVMTALFLMTRRSIIKSIMRLIKNRIEMVLTLITVGIVVPKVLLTIWLLSSRGGDKPKILRSRRLRFRVCLRRQRGMKPVIVNGVIITFIVKITNLVGLIGLLQSVKLIRRVLLRGRLMLPKFLRRPVPNTRRGRFLCGTLNFTPPGTVAVRISLIGSNNFIVQFPFRAILLSVNVLTLRLTFTGRFRRPTRLIHFDLSVGIGRRTLFRTFFMIPVTLLKCFWRKVILIWRASDSWRRRLVASVSRSKLAVY